MTGRAAKAGLARETQAKVSGAMLHSGDNEHSHVKMDSQYT